jgi:poly-beta-1,6-N-acetyl-D-glucosamine biosynthesis protein PgaD
MKTLILNQYAQQSLGKRLIGNTLTGLGWGFWIYLWIPLFTGITLLLGSHPEQATSAASNSILALLMTLATHVSAVAIMIAVFLAWSLLQWAGKSFRREALRKQQVNASCPVSLAVNKVQAERHWRHAQSMVVSHDDVSGCIQQVEIIKSKSKLAQRKCPSVYLRTIPPNPKRQFNSIAISVHP